jgi:pimeloyl-ACP methyl ester carboxylesterase
MLPLAPSSAAAQATEWQDPSVHAATLVTVEPGVQLEVLDWGGSGRPILLLAGLGDTAHMFDDFAPGLAARHRVYALTRRGFGHSSAPETGYGIDRLAEDIISVIRMLRLKDPIIAGHSFAGEEMHILGHRYASEIGGLVYIDAAFDRADRSRDYDRKLAELPASPQPQASDLRTIATYRDFAIRNGLPVGPEAAVRDRYEVDAAGTIGEAKRPSPHVQQGITAAMTALVQAYHPEPIEVPAMAIYAVPEKSGDLMRPWYDQGDPAVRAKVEEAFALARARYRRHAEWFGTLTQSVARAIELPGQHHLFISHPAKVQDEIEAFAVTLDSGERSAP